MKSQTRTFNYPLNWLWRGVQLAFVLVPSWFVLRNLENNRQALVDFHWQLDLYKLVLAALLLVCAFGLLPLAARYALACNGALITYPKTYWAYFITQLSKYLPGGIWIYPGRVIALQRHGVSIAVTSIAMLLELSLQVSAGIIVFLPYSLAVGAEKVSIGWWEILVIVPIVVFLNPVVFNRLFRRLLGALGKSDVRVQMTFSRFGLILLTDIVFWLVTGAGFCFLVASVVPISVSAWLTLISAFSAAWVAGFLAFLTPAGLGVREGVLALLLAPLLPAPLPALIALLARIWWTMAELICVALAMLIGWQMARSVPQNASST